MRFVLRQLLSLTQHAAAGMAIAAMLVLGVTCRLALAEDVRETPLSPDEELATFRLGDKRLTVELVAAEPQLNSPVAISWDADGRMYVAEMIDYPLGPTAGRIRRLEDRDGDGRYEVATEFATGLNFPNGVLAARGGVFVTAAPDLLFLKDHDGDGKADEKHVVFTGFGQGNQQLRANGLTWGLDNWIYGANGRSDGNVRRPSDPPEQAVSIRGRDFRFRPDGSRLEAISGQSQFGQASDDWGNRFVSWNTIPIRQALFEQEFLDRNPRLSGFGVRDIADPNDTGQVFPISPRPQTFNRERTDYFNALSGLTIFRGDALGQEYQGSAFAGESLTSLVHRRWLMAEGPTFVARRGEHAREFLASSDSWFHPVNLATGPDGALYIVDFYRRWVEHPAFVAESLRKGIDWQKGTGHGRIWRVSRRELTWPPRAVPRMTSDSTAELTKHLESANGWRRDTAQRLLTERRDPAAIPFLRTIVAKARLPQAKLHALSILEEYSELDDTLLVRGLEDAEARVRQYALRLAAARLAASAPLRTSAILLADFPNSLTRFQLALALGRIDTPDKLTAMVKLAELEADDPWIPIAISGSLGRSSVPFLVQLVGKNTAWRQKPKPAQMRLLTQVAATIAREGDPAKLAACLDLIVPANVDAVGPGDLAILVGLAQGVADRGQSPRAIDGDLKTRRLAIGTMLTAARTMATAEDESIDHRQMAVEVLALLDPGSGDIFIELLKARHPQALQSAAANALAAASGATAEAMLDSWGAMTTATRRAVIAAALRSTAATAALVKAVEDEHILPRELEPSVRDALLAVRDPELLGRVKSLFQAEPRGPSRQEVIAKFSPVLTRKGDHALGAALFAKHCLVCHTIQGQGQRVGPDLSGIGARPKETLLIDLFDPSRQVSPDFVAYTLVTRQGQVMSGLVVSETAGSVTLRRAEGAQDIVLRPQIEELRGTGKSLMPEGLEQNLAVDDVADLLEFLSRPDGQLLATER